MTKSGTTCTAGTQRVRRASLPIVGWTAIGFLAAVILAAILAPVIAPFSPSAQDLVQPLQGPSSGHWLGTDTLGRDVLSRLLYGGRTSLVAVCVAAITFLAIGVPLGVVSGFVGGRADRVITYLVELVMSIPAIIMVLLVLAVFPANEPAAMVTLGVLSAVGLARVVRSVALSVRSQSYISAARIAGISTTRVLVTHVCRRILPTVIVQLSIFFGAALVFESSIGFLGLDGSPAAPTWGGMIAEASTVLDRDGWLLVPAGVLIALVVLAFSLLGDALRDATADAAPRAPRAQKAGALHSMMPAASTPAVRNSQALLCVESLRVTLTADATATLVDDVTFEIAAGQALGLIGESGCGKSLTAMAVLDLLPPSTARRSGRISFDGRVLFPAGRQAYRGIRGSGIALVSQNPHTSLDPTFSIGSQLSEVIRRHDRCSRTAARKRAVDLLADVRIHDPEQVYRRYPHEVSGGMAQRAAIAMAISCRPKLLIADELTSALDVIVQSELLSLLRGLQRDTGMALMVITHDWGVAAEVCDDALIMYAGQVVETASLTDLYRAPLHPYSAALQAANPANMPPGGSDLPEITGTVPTFATWGTGCRFAPRCRLATAECETPDVIRLVQVGESRRARCIRTEGLATTGSS